MEGDAAPACVCGRYRARPSPSSFIGLPGRKRCSSRPAEGLAARFRRTYRPRQSSPPLPRRPAARGDRRPGETIVLEPSGRNTAPAACCSRRRITRSPMTPPSAAPSRAARLSRRRKSISTAAISIGTRRRSWPAWVCIRSSRVAALNRNSPAVAALIAAEQDEEALVLLRAIALPSAIVPAWRWWAWRMSWWWRPRTRSWLPQRIMPNRSSAWSTI